MVMGNTLKIDYPYDRIRMCGGGDGKWTWAEKVRDENIMRYCVALLDIALETIIIIIIILGFAGAADDARVKQCRREHVDGWMHSR